MTTLTSADPKKAMHQNLVFLREYARRVIVEGDDSLSLLEDVKTALIDDMWEASKAFNLSERDMAVLLFKGLFPQYPYYLAE